MSQDSTNTVSAASAPAIKKERVWELDALRGLFIICVVIIHAIFDMRYFLGMNINTPKIYDFIQDNGGVLFIIISGICVTLGTHFLKRGLIVLGAGGLITLATYFMYRLNFSGKDIIIYWGILHLLGFCMIVYGLIRKLPLWLTGVLGAAFVALGFYLNTVITSGGWMNLLVPFGLRPYGFMTGDYFPIFPHLGWFMLGIVLGRTVYKKKQTLLPKFPYKSWPIRALSFVGRHSLWIYLLHQPILSGIVELILLIKGS